MSLAQLARVCTCGQEVQGSTPHPCIYYNNFTKKKDVIIDIHAMFMMCMMLLHAMEYGILLTLAIMVVLMWVSLDITTIPRFMLWSMIFC